MEDANHVPSCLCRRISNVASALAGSLTTVAGMTLIVAVAIVRTRNARNGGPRHR